MDDPIIDAIRRGHEEEIEAELREKEIRRFPSDVLSELYEVNLKADLIHTTSEECAESLKNVNTNVYELHTTVKQIRSYLKFIAYCSLIITLIVAKDALS